MKKADGKQVKEKDVEGLIEHHGLRQTKTRQLLLSFFLEEKRPIPVMEIQAYFKRLGQKVHKTTLYRELETLVTCGALEEVVLFAECLHYELTSLGHHHHFLCTVCQRTLPVTIQESEVERAAKSLMVSGHRVTAHRVDFIGVCNRCKK